MVRRTSPLISLTAVPSAAAASGVFHSITGMKSSRMKRPSFASPHRERSAYSRLTDAALRKEAPIAPSSYPSRNEPSTMSKISCLRSTQQAPASCEEMACSCPLQPLAGGHVVAVFQRKRNRLRVFLRKFPEVQAARLRKLAGVRHVKDVAQPGASPEVSSSAMPFAPLRT